MEKNLTTGSVFKVILTFALPYLLSYFLQTLYGMADLYITGRFCGVDSITAVGAHVRHAVFGPGTVESVAGRRVTVRFTAGPRTLDAQVVAERHLMWAE